MKTLRLIGAYLLFGIGVISMFLPIPGGVIVLAVGLALVISASPPAQFCVKWLRTRSSLFDRLIRWIDLKVGGRIDTVRLALETTTPGANPNADKSSQSDTIE